jgi:hypothetical protein
MSEVKTKTFPLPKGLDIKTGSFSSVAIAISENRTGDLNRLM